MYINKISQYYNAKYAYFKYDCKLENAQKLLSSSCITYNVITVFYAMLRFQRIYKNT